jgi:hypothetical protein
MRLQRRLAGRLSSLAIVAMLAGSADAAPIVVDLTAFVGPQTVIDFDDPLLGNNVLLTTQFASEGVTFDPTNGGAFAFGTSVRNFAPVVQPIAGSITIDFTETMLRAGFLVATQQSDDLTVEVEAFRNGTLMTTLSFVTGLTQTFVGIEDSVEGIDSLVLTAVGPNIGNFNIDDLRFQTALIPEPSAALLFPTGLLLAAHGIRRRRQRA